MPAESAGNDARRAVPTLPRGSGVYVVVAGPDGTGKSTVVDELIEQVLRGPVMQLHHRPHLLRPRSPSDGPVTEPHQHRPYPLPLSAGKLLLLYADYLLGWYARLRPWLRDGGDVILERGWWDLAVDPARYRLHPLPGAVRLLGRLLPRPTVTLVLGGDATAIAARKRELSAEETQRQLDAWRALPPKLLRSQVIDTTLPLDATHAAVQRAVQDAQSDDQRWALLPTASRARWYLPTTPARASVNALRLYNPVTPVGRLGWEAARQVAALGGFRLLGREGRPPPREVMALLGPHLPPGARVAVARGRHEGRSNALVLDGRTGAALAFAKLATDDAGPASLAAEVEAARRLAPALPAGLRAPRVLHHEEQLVLYDAVAARPRRRPWSLPPEVAFDLGRFHRAGRGANGSGPAHGDVAPWNLLWTGSAWYLVDWSDARPDAPPFEDVFHFLVQAHALLGRPGRTELLEAFHGRGRSGDAIRRYAAGAQVDVGRALELIPDHLRRTLATIDRTALHAQRGVQAREALLASLTKDR
jgi:thymidylate kinase